MAGERSIMDSVQSSIFAGEIRKKLEEGKDNFRTASGEAAVVLENIEGITPQLDSSVDEKGNGTVHFVVDGSFRVDGLSQMYSSDGYAIAKDSHIESIAGLPLVIRRK